jgi:hypothetical protein
VFPFFLPCAAFPLWALDTWTGDSKYMDRGFFRNLATDSNTFHLKYIDAFDAPIEGVLYFLTYFIASKKFKPYDINFAIDIEKFLETFWIAVHLSDSIFGAPAGATPSPFEYVSKRTAFADI